MSAIFETGSAWRSCFLPGEFLSWLMALGKKALARSSILLFLRYTCLLCDTHQAAMPGATSLLRAWAAQRCEQARSARRCSVLTSAQSSGHYERVLRYPNGVFDIWAPTHHQATCQYLSAAVSAPTTAGSWLPVRLLELQLKLEYGEEAPERSCLEEGRLSVVVRVSSSGGLCWAGMQACAKQSSLLQRQVS